MSQKQLTIVVAIITNEKGGVLLAKRNQPDIPSEHNKWEFVGGGIDFGETPEQALMREVKEEAGVEIEVVRLLPKIFTQIWKAQEPERHIIIISYECKIVGGELKPKDSEVSELKFVPVQEIKNYECLPNVDKIIDMLH